MSDPRRPRIVVSRCLGFLACRYNGQMLHDPFVSKLATHAEMIPVCPEVEIGLGTPRAPIRIEAGRRLVQPATGLDLTARMEEFADEYLSGLGEVDGFLLKSRSPSCGVSDAKVHGDGGRVVGRGPGRFAAAVLDRFPLAAVEDEGRLTNFRIREHFLTRVFATAAFREVRHRRSMAGLVRFHSERKLLFMALNQTVMRELGRIVANPGRRPVAAVLDDYAATLPRAFARIATFRSHINVLLHAFGYFKREITAREKARFLDELELYREGRRPLSAPLAILGSLIARFEEAYLESQVYFHPFPLDLVEITDSGKGRGA